MQQRAYMFASSIGDLTFDTAISETHQAGLAVTEYPVEAGAPITDHAYRQPRVLTLTVGHGVRRFRALSFLEPDTLRLTEFYESLLALQEGREVVEVTTALTNYTNMIVTSLQAVRDKTFTTTVKVVVVLREVIEIDLELLEDYTRKYSEVGGTIRKAAPTSDQGRVATTPMTPTEEVDNGTAASRFLRGFGVDGK